MDWRDHTPFPLGIPSACEAGLINDTADALGNARIVDVLGADLSAPLTADVAMAILGHLPATDDGELVCAWVAVAAAAGHIGSMRRHADALAGYGLLTPEIVAAAVSWSRAAELLLDGGLDADPATMIMSARAHVRRTLAVQNPIADRLRALRNQAAGEEPACPAMIVLRKPDDGERKAKAEHDPLSEYKAILGVPLPLVRRPDLTAVRAKLVGEFPHASSVIDAVLRDAASAGDDTLRLRPTLFVGAPGCGKTRLAHRLCDELDVPLMTVPVAGAMDAHLLGVAKGWSTGHGSVVAEAFRRHRAANPAILLDELEKAGTSRHNGNVLDALLPLLEPETSARWRDPYVGQLNASRVIWLATANTVEPIPAPLRSRIRVLRVPDPAPEHVPLLAASIMRDVVRDQGLDERWVQPLDGEEVAALEESMSVHRSVRLLRRQVERVLELREMPCA